MNLITRLRWIAGVAFSIAATLLTEGCNDTGKQRSLAEAASAEFRIKYNRREFDRIYEEADGYLHRHASPQWWKARLTEIYKDLGSLKEFRPLMGNSYPFGQPGIVWVSGPAEFETGPAQLRLDWDISGDHPKLFNIQIERPSSTISIPGFTGQRFE